MSALSVWLGRQLAEPQGASGRLLGTAMDFANRTPTRMALDLLAPAPGLHVLDAGCGTGAVVRKLVQEHGCRVTGVDRSAAMVSAAHRLLRDECAAGEADILAGSIGALPLDDGSFDAVLALNVLYFADRAGRMMADLRRVLRTGGKLVAYVTHRDTMRDWSFTRHNTHRLYDEAELTEAFIEGGFSADKVTVLARPVTRQVKGLLAIAHA